MTDTRKATPRPWAIRLNKSADGYWLVTSGPEHFASIRIGEPATRFLGPDGTEVQPIVHDALAEAFERQAQSQNAFDALYEALERCLEVLNIVKDTPKSDAVDMARRALRLAAAERRETNDGTV